MAPSYTESDLENYLDEALPAEEMADFEQRLRKDKHLLVRLSAINARRDQGVHSLGEVWRRNRLTCPSRDQLGSYLMQTLDDAEAEFITRHLQVSGCRLCQANLADLERRLGDQPQKTATRRRKYFESSAGYLPSR